MKPTGLWKRCPRCWRMGEVLFDEQFSTPGNPAFVVVWQPKGEDQGRRDTLVRGPDLLDPEFGCGFDAATPKLDT